jgi:NADH dehydrogenase/NADH:ubiquinone oxidoreductase subunit G
MSKKVNVTIDGKETQVPEGTNLIDAAESVGVHIPNLCYLKGMRGIGACRMCLIEIEGMKAPMIGCTTRVKEGMAVNTKTQKVEEVRKFVIDLILSMHPLDCMTCTKAGVCNLQKYAYDFEIKESKFNRKKFGYPVDEANPFIKRDPDYCVLCGRCVRVCKEQGTNVLEFMGRGVGSKIGTAMDKPLQESECTFCGSCVDACPVNALLEADRWRKGREWEYTMHNSVCLSCGNGCDITVSEKDGSVVKINAGADDGSVEKYICATGRFGFESTVSDARVTTPMKRVDDKLQETSWKEALEIVADKLKGAKGNTGIISTGNILNQDAFVVSKFASDVMKTKNVDTTVSLYSDADSLRHSDTVDIDNADAIVMVGLSTSQKDRVLPALDAAIRKRASRGAKLIVINPKESAAGAAATVNIQADEALSLSGLSKALIDAGCKADKDLSSAVSGSTVSEEIAKAAELLKGAQSPVIFCSPSLFNAAQNLSLILKTKVVAVPFEANARGVVTLGLNADGKTYQEMVSGSMYILYAIGEVPVEERPRANFVVAQTSYLTDFAKEADVVLPAASYLETKGTITNYLGKNKTVNRIIEPAGDSMQHKDIIIELSKAMGSPIKESEAKIKSTEEVGKPSFSPFEKKQGLEVNAGELADSLNTSIFKNSKLIWLKEAKEAAV